MPVAKKNLCIKRSGIPKAGKGLFTKISIPKGAVIAEYEGEITTWKKVQQTNEFNGYVFYISKNHVIDARPYIKSFARYINDAKGITRIEGLQNNSKYVNEDNRIFIYAIKDIPAGSEIFVSYKKDYWDVIRHNMKLASKEKK
ncbi:MAG: SET domain-containing protein [Bacteroidota bacterium]|nr:SET domain-containing protein [Bacteroidota bacterium]